MIRVENKLSLLLSLNQWEGAEQNKGRALGWVLEWPSPGQIITILININSRHLKKERKEAVI